MQSAANPGTETTVSPPIAGMLIVLLCVAAVALLMLADVLDRKDKD